MILALVGGLLVLAGVALLCAVHALRIARCAAAGVGFALPRNGQTRPLRRKVDPSPAEGAT